MNWRLELTYVLIYYSFYGRQATPEIMVLHDKLKILNNRHDVPDV